MYLLILQFESHMPYNSLRCVISLNIFYSVILLLLLLLLLYFTMLKVQKHSENLAEKHI